MFSLGNNVWVDEKTGLVIVDYPPMVCGKPPKQFSKEEREKIQHLMEYGIKLSKQIDLQTNLKKKGTL